MNSYEERLEARRQRLLERAERKRREANGHKSTADQMASVIPFGQPILVGHYSEKSDRRYRERIYGHMRKWIDLDNYARELERRAESVGTAGISSGDPEAVLKLKAQVARLEEKQEKMKQVNRAIRAGNDEDLRLMGLSDAIIAKLRTPDFLGRVGFADYELKNNNANIRRIKQRIAQLEQASQAEAKEIQGDGFKVEESPEENRILFFFDDKPAEEIRRLLKQSGFKWSPTRGAWVRFLNSAGRAAASYVIQKLKELK